jgi:hypothetical protein
MTTLPYSTIDLTSDEIETILSIYNSLQSKQSVDFRADYFFPFKDFSLFETYQDYSIGPVIEIIQNINPTYLTFTQVSYKTNLSRRNFTSTIKEYQSWCTLTLKNKYGNILIKTETLLDKIHEIIHPIEVDFKEDADFSKEFYVMASDQLLASSLLNAQIRGCLKQLNRKDVWIEIAGENLIIGNKKPIDTEATMEMCDLLIKIAELQK